ncbi:MAG TPA: hypothetical protein VIM06_10660, partial [Rhodanobacter sp.]
MPAVTVLRQGIPVNKTMMIARLGAFAIAASCMPLHAASATPAGAGAATATADARFKDVYSTE